MENRLGAEGQGFKVAMQVLDRGRLHISAVCVGVAERLLVDCVAYAQERKQFGQALSSFQMIQAMLADSKTEALAARALTMETARRKDRGDNVVMESAAAKLYASEMVGRVADRAVQIFGGAGYISRVRHRAPVPRRAHLPHLRGYERSAEADHRARDDQARGVRGHPTPLRRARRAPEQVACPGGGYAAAVVSRLLTGTGRPKW